MARPHDGTWADYVAVFRKATDQPFERKGRIADHTTAMNIFDGAKLDPMQLDAERAETWDMLDAARARAEAGQAQAESRPDQIAGRGVAGPGGGANRTLGPA